MTLNPSIPTKFEAMWEAANASRSSPVNFTDYATVWKTFVNETETPGVSDALLWNIGVRECEVGDHFSLSASRVTR